MKKEVRQGKRAKLHLHRETLQILTEPRLTEVEGAAPTKAGLMCNTFSDPSLCATCLCT
jgi:hypothetical protein